MTDQQRHNVEATKMMARRIRQIIQCAKMQLNAGNLLRAQAYYVEAGKLITHQRLDNARTAREIEKILASHYSNASN